MIIAWANTQVHVTQGSWLGNVGAGGLGIGILVGSIMLAKKEKGPFSENMQKRMTKKFDGFSLMSCALGFFGVTAILGSTGKIADFTHWLQEMVLNIQSIGFISTVGMGVVCLIVGIKVFAAKNDPVPDIYWGGALALIFPLGGGMWAETSVWSANMLVQLMSGVPSS
jgi:hypothetical protein